MSDDIIVIGAGACGLMAARILSVAGKQVRVVEARDRAGGRILTIPPGKFCMHIEGGAEFIHGELPVTLRVLKEAGLSYHRTGGEMWNARKDDPHREHEFIVDYSLFIRKLRALKEDVSVSQFLESNFKGENFAELRASVTGFVEGYDLANSQKASTFSLREEWTRDDEDQYRIDKGYGALTDFLQSQCEEAGCKFHFNTTIKKISWRKNEVNLVSDDGNSFSAKKVIITIPLGLLQSNSSHKAHIEFSPSLINQIEAAKAMGYGDIVKFIFEFNEAFWKNKKQVENHGMKNLGFIFSSEIVPTWWTQFPLDVPILTGWLGGPKAGLRMEMNDEGLLQVAIDSLSSIFRIDHAELVEKLAAWEIFNWGADDYSLGGYAYNSLERRKYLNILSTPEEGTLFFSGEAMGEGPTLGTVESALDAGERSAFSILNAY